MSACLSGVPTLVIMSARNQSRRAVGSSRGLLPLVLVSCFLFAEGGVLGTDTVDIRLTVNAGRGDKPTDISHAPVYLACVNLVRRDVTGWADQSSCNGIQMGNGQVNRSNDAAKTMRGWRPTTLSGLGGSQSFDESWVDKEGAVVAQSEYGPFGA